MSLTRGDVLTFGSYETYKTMIKVKVNMIERADMLDGGNGKGDYYFTGTILIINADEIHEQVNLQPLPEVNHEYKFRYCNTASLNTLTFVDDGNNKTIGGYGIYNPVQVIQLF